jgi:hypothetical protein
MVDETEENNQQEYNPEGEAHEPLTLGQVQAGLINPVEPEGYFDHLLILQSQFIAKLTRHIVHNANPALAQSVQNEWGVYHTAVRRMSETHGVVFLTTDEGNIKEEYVPDYNRIEAELAAKKAKEEQEAKTAKSPIILQ